MPDNPRTPDNARDSVPPANVVSLDGARAARERRAVAALPDVTGVAQIAPGPLLDNLHASCLTDATIDAARLFTLPSSKWKPFGFRSARPQSGVLLPFFAPDIAEPFAYRLRPQHPLPTRKRGKLKKYDQSVDGVLVYLPPLAATLDGRKDIARPLYWTEGEKKALLLAQLGYVVVGLTGVDCWLDVDAKRHGDGARLHRFIAEHYAIAGRAHVIVFDADARAKPNVMLAMQRLAGVLSAAGAASVHMALPPDAADAKGIDDYAHAHGVDAARNLLDTLREPIDELAPDAGLIPLSKLGHAFDGCGAGHLRMPRAYDVERDGSIWVSEDPAQPDDKKLVMDAPMLLARQLTELYTGEIRSEVRFRDARGAWRSVIVPREVLGDRALVGALRPYGALVNAAASTAVMRYLDAFERDNGDAIVQARCSSQTGWHDGQFVLSDTIARDGVDVVQLDGRPEQLRAFGAIAPAPGAELARHLQALKRPMEASAECALAVFAALAAPLLALVKQGNFALHLHGDSSRGKTSMLRVAASVYGDPRNPAWVASWNTTLSGLEQRASLLCDLPQFYDEVGSADIQQVESYVYMLVNGEGRQRSTKELRMRPTLAWRTVVISSGEFELADAAAATGAQARVINVAVHGFGELDAAAIDAAVAECSAHYGAVGRAWLEWLVSLDDEDVSDLRELFGERVAELRAVAAANGDALGQRTAGYFAAMSVAEDQINGQWPLIGSDGGAVTKAAFAARSGDTEQRVATLSERVLNALRDWVASAPASFPAINDVTSETVRVCGYTRDTHIAFLRGPLEDYLTARGLRWTRALQRELRESGMLLTDPGQRAIGQDTCRVWVAGKSQRVLCILSGSPIQTGVQTRGN